jgi:hypothetical protein
MGKLTLIKTNFGETISLYLELFEALKITTVAGILPSGQ